MTFSHTLRTAAATILVAAAVVLLPHVPASAAACSGSTGITVVVDSNQLGAGISAGCDPDGGVAANNFADAGYKIEYSQAAGMSGFVCKVNGSPSDGDCTETDAYWSLWWSDGKSGAWTYAARGVSSLRVPDGGYVAFAWHQGSGQATPPDVAATPRFVEPKPTPTPTKASTPKPTKKPSPKAAPSPTSATPSASPSASATPSATGTTATPSATPTATPTEAAPTEPSQTTTVGLPSIDEITDGPRATAADADGDEDAGGFPAWLGIGLVVVVLGAAGAVPVLRRRGR
ncbi:hypothetical protein [Pimelobacter simplex]|uniref:hypothetical protein n=1 Tax=Nocardioides simplex TaxID=2045 RepID=UPI0019335F92|nr:hypothetical protein [Pimelobacter simplex]